MTQPAIIYHSAHGHTEHIARNILEGAQQVEGVDAHLVKAEDIGRRPNDLVHFDNFILGSPTYLGGVSGPFKSFMDATPISLFHWTSMFGRYVANTLLRVDNKAQQQATVEA